MRQRQLAPLPQPLQSAPSGTAGYHGPSLQRVQASVAGEGEASPTNARFWVSHKVPVVPDELQQLHKDRLRNKTHMVHATMWHAADPLLLRS